MLRLLRTIIGKNSTKSADNLTELFALINTTADKFTVKQENVSNSSKLSPNTVTI